MCLFMGRVGDLCDVSEQVQHDLISLQFDLTVAFVVHCKTLTYLV